MAIASEIDNQRVANLLKDVAAHEAECKLDIDTCKFHRSLNASLNKAITAARANAYAAVR